MWHRIDDPDNPPPKDGTWILVNDIDAWGPRVQVVRWDEWIFSGKRGFDWQTIELGPYNETHTPQATHWMPLPPPPTRDTP